MEIIIVDDGSKTDCAEVWAQTKPYAVILHHPENRGKGAALKTAFSYIREQLPEVQIIVTMDADGQHLISDMINVVNAAWLHQGVLILGSRSFGKDVPRFTANL